MPDLDDELRRILAAKAGGVHPGEEAPSGLLRRSRRRRALTALVATGAAAGVVTAASLSVAGMVREEPGAVIGPAGSPSPTTDEWRGIWPQRTRADAEEAQRRADEGQHQFDFQLDPEYLLQRFAIEALEWRSWEDIRFASPLPNESSSGPETILMGDCEEVGADECTREAEVTIERLLRHDPTGIWVVTNVAAKDAVRIPPSPLPVEPTPTGSPELSDVGEAEEFVRAFLEARLDGSGAERFLSPGAAEKYEDEEGGLRLYSPAGRWEDPYITGVENTGNSMPQPPYRIGVKISTPQDHCVESIDEVLTVTRDANDQLLIVDAEVTNRGLDRCA